MSAHKFYREIVLHDDECQISFVSRLAKANGYRDLADFCWMTNFKLSALQCLDDEKAELLSMWSGIPAAHLQRFALTGNNVTSFGATYIRRSQLETTTLRVCRHCLRHDMQTGQGRIVTRPYVRATWRWLVIGSCPIHGCELEAINTDDIAAWVARRGDSLTVNLPEIRQPSPADIYFASRVTGAGETSEFLDQHPAYVAAEFCTIIGHFKNPPEKGQARDRVPDGFMNASCREEGYMIARDGEKAIMSFLSNHVQNYVEDIPEFKNIYGAARRWLRKYLDDPDYRPLVELFQHHAEHHIPMEAGDVFLKEVKERHIHTISSAAAEYKLPLDRVKNVVEKLGYVLHGSDASPRVRRVFPRAELHEHLILEKQLLTTSEAASILGCSWDFLDILLQQGHLPYHLNSESSARAFRRLTRENVEGLLEWLRAKRDSNTPDDDMVSIQRTTAICHCTVSEVIDLIFGGKLRRLSWSGEELSLKNLLLDPQEVLPHVALANTGNHLNVAALEKALHTTTATVNELLNRKFIPAEHRRHPRTRNMQRVVHPAAVKEFLAKHISLSMMARENGKPLAQIKQLLDKNDISPIFEPTGKIARFYRRADVQRLGLA